MLGRPRLHAPLPPRSRRRRAGRLQASASGSYLENRHHPSKCPRPTATTKCSLSNEGPHTGPTLPSRAGWAATPGPRPVGGSTAGAQIRWVTGDDDQARGSVRWKEGGPRKRPLKARTPHTSRGGGGGTRPLSGATTLTWERRPVGREDQLVGDGFGSGVVVHVLPRDRENRARGPWSAALLVQPPSCSWASHH